MQLVSTSLPPRFHLVPTPLPHPVSTSYISYSFQLTPACRLDYYMQHHERTTSRTNLPAPDDVPSFIFINSTKCASFMGAVGRQLEVIRKSGQQKARHAGHCKTYLNKRTFTWSAVSAILPETRSGWLVNLANYILAKPWIMFTQFLVFNTHNAHGGIFLPPDAYF